MRQDILQLDLESKSDAELNAMAEKLKPVSVAYQHTHTNDTDEWQIVANDQEVLSSHATQEAAEQAMAGYPRIIDDTPYATLGIVAPGKSVSGKYDKTEWPDKDLYDAISSVLGSRYFASEMAKRGVSLD